MRLLLLLAVRNLSRNLRRTGISMAAVAFGVLAIIVSGGFVESLLIKLREDTIYSHFGHIRIEDARSAARGLSDPYAYLLSQGAASLKAIAGLPGVRTVMPRLAFSGLVSVGGTTLSFTGDAIDPAQEQLFNRGLAIIQGESLRANDVDAVVLGEGLAVNLGAKLGEKVVLLVNTPGGGINAREFIVRGTFASISKLYDDTALRLPVGAAEALLRVRGVQQWNVLLESTEATRAMLQKIRALLPDGRFALTSWDQNADFYHKTSTLFARQFGFARAIIVVIIMLSILNTMTMNVIERTWEVGVMLAVGDSRRQVLALFACEGALLGLLGSLLGAVGGVLIGWALNTLGIPMPAPPGMNHGFDAGVVVSPALALTAVAIGFAAAALASLLPAVRASRLVVVNALRQTR